MAVLPRPKKGGLCRADQTRKGYEVDGGGRRPGSSSGKLWMDDIFSQLSFGMGRRNKETPQTAMALELYKHPYWSDPTPNDLRPLAEKQLGTIGSGNHYVDLFVDELDRVWIGNHFGSRGLGHKTATTFLKKGGVHSDDMHAFPTVFALDSDLGEQYWRAMVLCGDYAMAGRDWVCRKVASDILRARIQESVHNHHNFAWKEEIDGEEAIVVRKGATPNYPGQRSFVGGSMGSFSYILEGQYVEAASEAQLHSTIHGAGRVMGRMQATGKTKWARLSRMDEGGDLVHLRDKMTPEQTTQLEEFVAAGCPKELDVKIGVVTRQGQVTQQMMDEWVNRVGIELRGAGTDESPHCYKDIEHVLEDQGGTVKVVHRLTPLGVAMAGADIYDPFKD